MKKKFFSITLSVLMLTNYGCQTCDDALFIADLTYTLATVFIPQVTVLTALPLRTIVQNVAPVCKNDPNAGSAKATNQSFKANYRPDANSTWQDATIGGKEFVVDPINSLKSQENATKENGFKFTTPGIYRFACKADYDNALTESNENNNSATSGNGSVTGFAAPFVSDSQFMLEITVIDPSGKTMPNYDVNQKVSIAYLGSQTIK